MITINNLVFTFQTKTEPVLQGIDLDIEEGAYLAVIGPNGCGKTTLIRHLNGLLRPSRGDVLVDGLSTKDPRALAQIRQKVGMVFQNPDNQIVGMTVEEDVSFGPGNLGLEPSEIRKRVRYALELVGMLKYADHPPHTLSGGEKQLVAIAGVLAMNPSYIALDEPTSFLDPMGRKRVLGVIKSLHERGIGILHISHDMDEIVDADRILVMEGGRILLNEAPSQVFSRVEWLRGLGLGVPAITALLWHLREMGANLSPDILTLEDACRELSALIGEKSSGLRAP